MQGQKKLAIHLYPSPITHESRMIRTARASLSASDVSSAHLVGLKMADLPAKEALDERIEVTRLSVANVSWMPSSIRKVIMLLDWYRKISNYYLANRPALVCAHSLSALPIAVYIKIRCRSVLVYEPHELETESIASHGIRRIVSRFVEKALIRKADKVVVVGEKIADWYEHNYSIPRPLVIRNLPDVSVQNTLTSKNVVNLRQKFNIPDNSRLYLYQGVMGDGRFVREILNVFSTLDVGNQLVFVGYGSLESLVSQFASEYSNIHYFGAVLPGELASYTEQADIGLCLIENKCLSYFYSLPNKLFEYLSCGVPVVASNFPEIAEVVSAVNGGHLIETDANVLREYITSNTLVSLPRVDANVVRSRYGWRQESMILENYYKSLAGTDEVRGHE